MTLLPRPPQLARPVRQPKQHTAERIDPDQQRVRIAEKRAGKRGQNYFPSLSMRPGLLLSVLKGVRATDTGSVLQCAARSRG